eukprot:9016183-Pyramimonas_sp.AAC.1
MRFIDSLIASSMLFNSGLGATSKLEPMLSYVMHYFASTVLPVVCSAMTTLLVPTPLFWPQSLAAILMCS